MRNFRMLIDGELVDSASGRTAATINPATEEVITEVPDADVEDAKRAVDAAHAAFPAWRARRPAERCEMLFEFARRLRERKQELAELEAADSGNPVATMATDVDYASATVEYFAGLGREMKGETVPATGTGLHLTVREPYGVVVRIIPFNHPLLFAASRIAAPLVAGNTVVLKPAPQTPLTALLIGEIAREVFPAGVLNIVTGGGATVGAALVADQRVRRVALTGSVETGRALLRGAAETMANVTLELGGKNPLIVFPDADPDRAAALAVAGMNFTWQSQSCGSTSRLLVHRSLHDRVVDRVVKTVESIRQGSPADPATEMGPVVSQQQYDRIMSYIDAARDEGAELRTGGGRPTGDGFDKGFFIAPTVFTGVTPAMRIANEEIFGPVLSVLPWDDEDEVIALANNVGYGLTANLCTNDVTTVLRVFSQLEAGYVWVNGAGQHFLGLPFGGYKNSGIGREEGLEEIHSFTQVKSLSILPAT